MATPIMEIFRKRVVSATVIREWARYPAHAETTPTMTNMAAAASWVQPRSPNSPYTLLSRKFPASTARISISAGSAIHDAIRIGVLLNSSASGSTALSEPFVSLGCTGSPGPELMRER